MGVGGEKVLKYRYRMLDESTCSSCDLGIPPVNFSRIIVNWTLYSVHVSAHDFLPVCKKERSCGLRILSFVTQKNELAYTPEILLWREELPTKVVLL